MNSPFNPKSRGDLSQPTNSIRESNGIGRTSSLKASNRMFITDASAHHPFMSRLLGNGKDAWRAVGLTAPREWFYVSYTLSTPKGNLAETALNANPARGVKAHAV